MASNALTMFNNGGLPAHIANFFGEEDANVVDNRQTVPSLSPQGKIWTIALGGEKTKLIRRNEDGDEVPVSVMRVVVLDYAKRRGRTYYEGSYDPDKESAPVCWSDDGIKPDDSVPDEIKETKTSFKCDGCPMAIKGSKVADNGKQLTACAQHRMLAVVPAYKLDFTPLRLKIAITSDFDKQSPDAEAQGWFAFSNYMDFLKSKGVTHTASLVTKMKFDANAAYPKIFFAADRWLEAGELAQVAPLTKDEEVKKLLGGTFTPAGVDGVRKDATTDSVEKPQTAAQEATRAAATADEDDDDGGEIIMAGIDAPADEPKQEPAQAAAEPKAAKSKPEPAKAAQKAEAAAPAASTAIDPEVAALLSEWE